jgi:hypothetical protein
MAASDIWITATEYRRNALTINSGTVADITAVGVALRDNPNDVPDPSGTGLGEFTAVTLDTAGPDVVTLFGPRGGDIVPTDVGDFQVFVLIRTADEDIIRRPSVLTVTGLP